MEHVKGYGRERTHTQTMDRLQVPKEGRTCQREEKEQGRGRGMWHGQEVLVMLDTGPRSVLSSSAGRGMSYQMKL